MRSKFPFYKNFHTDHDLLRFLRARNFDLAATQKLYNKFCTVVSFLSVLVRVNRAHVECLRRKHSACCRMHFHMWAHRVTIQ